MNTDTHNTIKNSFYSISGYLFPILFTVFITPIIFHKLGAKEYGVLIFVNSIMTILGLIDGGISTGTVKRLAEYIGQKNENKIRDLIRTAHSLFLIVGLTGIVVTGILYMTLNFFFSAEFINNPEISYIMLIVSINFLIASINNMYVLIPNAVQRFDISMKTNILIVILGNTFNLIAILIFGTLTSLFISQLILTCLFFFVWRYNSLKLLPVAKYSLGWIRYEVKKSVTFSFYTIINELSRTALFSLDRIIIPILIGASNLGYYALAGNATARIPGISDNLSGVVFPISANLHGQESFERIQTLYIRSTRLINIISSAITVAIIANSYEILKFWIGVDVAENAWKAMVILAITNFILALLSPVATFLMVFEKWKFYTTLSSVMAVLNIGFIFILIPPFGITGAAIAYLLSVLPIFYAIYTLERQYLKIPARIHFHIKQVFNILLTSTLFAIFNYFIIKPFITNFTTLIILGPLSVIVYITIYYILGFIPNDDIRDIRTSISKKIPWMQSQK